MKVTSDATASSFTLDLFHISSRASLFEDVFPADAVSVEEYLGAVHEMTMLAAMQEVERSSASAFESHMRHVMQDEWQRTSPL